MIAIPSTETKRLALRATLESDLPKKVTESETNQ